MTKSCTASCLLPKSFFFLFTLLSIQISFAQSWSPNGTSLYYNGGSIGIGTSIPAYQLDLSSADNSEATGNVHSRLRIANTTSSGNSAPGSHPVIELLGARGDANGTYYSRLALGTRRTDGNPLSNQTLGVMLFGGQYGGDPTFQETKVLYPASVQGIAEGPFTASTAMPTGIAFFTGSTGASPGADNTNYGAERMRITNAGNVGIGTTAPRTQLDIWGGTLDITGSDHNGTLVGGSQAGSAFLGCNSLANGIAINSSGNVGLGTSQPGSYKLAVEGTVGARKVVVTQAAWADYVFYKNYDLPSIRQVKAYIILHHHLPGVPSAKEVQDRGLDIADNQAILLKKIEELTLYTIDQDKKLESQQQQIDELKTLVKKLLAKQ